MTDDDLTSPQEFSFDALHVEVDLVLPFLAAFGVLGRRLLAGVVDDRSVKTSNVPAFMPALDLVDLF